MERRTLVVLFLLLSLSACGGGSGGSAVPQPPPPPVGPPPVTPPGDPPSDPSDGPPEGPVPSPNEPPPAPATPKLSAYTDLMFVDLQWEADGPVDLIYSTDRNCDWSNYAACPGGTLIPQLPASGSKRLEAVRDGLGADRHWYFVVSDSIGRSPVRRARAARADLGSVMDTSTREGTLYAAGVFYRGIGPTSGNLIHADAVNGRFIDTFPKFDGQVNAAVPDGAGGWFIGGEFRWVGSQATENLVRIDASGAVVSSWIALVNGAVHTLLLHDGVLYVGGEFDQVNFSVTRRLVAAFDAETAELKDWDPNVFGTHVSTMALAFDGLMIGGSFLWVSLQPRGHLAVVDLETGSPLPWRKDASHGVRKLAANSSHVAVVGGFTQVGGMPRTFVAVFDAVGELASWTPAAGTSGGVDDAFFLPDGRLVVGGWVNGVGGHVSVFQPDISTAQMSHQGLPGQVDRLAYHQGAIYGAGNFDRIDGEIRYSLAKLDATDLTLSPWTSNVNGTVRVIRGDGDRMLIGGELSAANTRYRPALAAFDVQSGLLTEWSPDFSAVGTPSVDAIAVVDGTLYLNGNFNAVNGQARQGTAAFETPTGELTDWQAPTDGSLMTFAGADGKFFIGGFFSQVEGEPRMGVAAYSTATGVLASWDAGLHSGHVRGIGFNDGRAYLWGAPRPATAAHQQNIAVVDLTTGTAVPWREYRNTDASFSAVLITESFVYVGGDFTELDGEPRERVAALDLATGDIDPDWRPAVTGGRVRGLARAGADIVLVGAFTHVNGVAKPGIARVNAETGVLSSWSPDGDVGTDLRQVLVEGDVMSVRSTITDEYGATRETVLVIDAITGEIKW